MHHPVAVGKQITERPIPVAASSPSSLVVFLEDHPDKPTASFLGKVLRTREAAAFST